MAHGYFQTPILSKLDQRLCLADRNSEWFFKVNVAAGLEALLGQRIMALRWRRDMNDVWRRRLQHLLGVRENAGNVEALGKLPSHERFLIANCDDAATRYSPYGVYMLISNLAATD